jgi:hypothetical protein
MGLLEAYIGQGQHMESSDINAGTWHNLSPLPAQDNTSHLFILPSFPGSETSSIDRDLKGGLHLQPREGREEHQQKRRELQQQKTELDLP